MTVRINKPAFNIREKLTELKHKPIELVSVETPEITTSGTNTYSIEGIHETDHPIYFRLNGTSVGTTSNEQYIRLGTEKDGIRNAGIYYWISAYGGDNASPRVYSANPGSEYYFAKGFNNVNNVFYTMIKIQRLSTTSNNYFMQLIGIANPGYPAWIYHSCCRVELGAPLYSVQLESGSNFDGGSISLQYIYERNL